MSTPPAFRTLTSRSNFYFVRHGESEANRREIIQGHNDSPLSRTGRSHARAAGRWLRDKTVEAVFTSPLSRSLQTAQMIAEITGAPQPALLDDLKELDTGIYSGVNLGTVAKEDPEAFKSFRIHSWEAVEGAERKESLMERALRVWERLIQAANGGTREVVCVTHGGMLQWIIKATMVCDEQRWMPIFGIANCGISHFTAESTSLDVEGELPPHTGYYGSWECINLVPY
jgi:broad specificity phosphatase PhoE